MPKLMPNYNCSQQELYSICEVGWKNYSNNNAGFTLLKGKYTVIFGTAALADVAAAKALPAKQTRDAIPESVRVQLVPLGQTCLANERRLKSYLEEVFVGDTTKTMLTAAGYGYYHDASKEGWEEMHSMNNLGAKFIADHTSALESGTTNMPAAFITTYTSGKTEFETVYNNYIQKSQDAYSGTNTKIAANNAIFSALTKMLSDGRLIFENDSILKGQFTFSTLLAEVAGPNTTGMRITVKDTITKLPITNFSVTVQPGDVKGNAEGKKVLELPMSADKYSIVIIVPGYPTYTNKLVEVTTGVMHKVDLVLVKTGIPE